MDKFVFELKPENCLHNEGAVQWNPFSGKTQCHKCGTFFVPQYKVDAEKERADKAEQEAASLFNASMTAIEQRNKALELVARFRVALERLVSLANEDDPIEVGCHCSHSGDVPITCVWCQAKEVLTCADVRKGIEKP